MGGNSSVTSMQGISFDSVSAKAIKPKDLTLSYKGISSVNWDYSDSDVQFIFGEDNVCRVWSVLADFLSPKIARLRRCDITFGVYQFTDSEVFNVFDSLVASIRSGEALRVEKSNFVALLRLSQEIENGELYSSLVDMIQMERLHLEQAIFLLRAGIALGVVFSRPFQQLRDLVARRFYKLNRELLEDLDLATTELLLSSPSLKVKDEDSLYSLVRSRCEIDLSFAKLFEFICFDYLTVNSIGDFVSFVSDNLLHKINTSIWRQICRRLVLDAKPKKNPRPAMGREVFYDKENPLDGIIAQLTRECGGNVHDKGIVTVTASSVYKNHLYHPKNVVDLGQDNFHGSDVGSAPNQWICYDFGERRVIPKSYSVRSYYEIPGRYHPKYWVIEGSNDGTEKSWTEIDRRDDNYDLNGAHVTVNFTISNVPSEGFRFLRFRQTGKNHNGNNILNINSLEFFGTVFGRMSLDHT